MSLPSLSPAGKTTVGARLIESTAYFQAGSAVLVSGENDKLHQLSIAASNHRIQATALTTVNKGISSTLAALSTLQKAITNKLTAASQLNASW